MKHKLRIGILLDNEMITAWSYKMLEEIKESNYAEIVVIIQNNAIVEREKQSILKKASDKRKEYNFSSS